MGNGLPVKVQAVPIKTPGQARIARKGCRAGNVGEIEPGLPQRRIGTPEAGLPAKIGQPGIDPHTGTGCNDQAIGLLDKGDSPLKIG